MVRLDETGLHAEDCACLRCESGYRPTAMERWRAREQLRKAQELDGEPARRLSAKMRDLQAARERRQRQDELRRQEERAWRAAHPPMTETQRRELEKAKEGRPWNKQQPRR